MSSVERLRRVGVLEGISFLLLLFVAVPLKHWFGLPIGVRVLGPIHGLLFLAFVYLLFATAAERSWPLRKSALAFVAALVPFGPFVLDRKLAHETEGDPLSTDTSRSSG